MTKTLKRTKNKEYVPTVLHKPRDMSVEEWREENGIPDWTKYDAYPKGLSRDQIKWEFLRRNYCYKLLFSEFVDEDGEFCSQRIDSNEDDIDSSEWAAIEYELPDLIDPRTKAIELKANIFTRHFRGSYVKSTYNDGEMLCSGNTQHRTSELIEDDRFAVFIFDLRYPLAHQINKRVLPQLKRMQDKLKNTGGLKIADFDSITKDYIKHLQILDAYSERVKSVDVGIKVIGAQDDKKARDRADKEFKRAMDMWRFF